MDPNRLTLKSQEALHDAQTKALRYGHTEVDGEHLLLALLEQPEGLIPRLLARADVDREPCAPRWSASSRRDRASAARAPATGRDRHHAAASRRCSTPREQEAKRLKDEYVSVEHLLLAMLASGEQTPRRAACCASRASPARPCSRS